MRYAWFAGAVSAFALLIGAQTAMAEAQAAQRTDPKAESPAGVIYQIPLDSARRDAAPVLPTGKRDDGAGAPASGGSGGPGSGSAGGPGNGGAGNGSGNQAGGAGANGSGSAGSSSGGTGGHGGGGATLSASAAEGGGTPQNPSSIHSENGFGSSSQVPGLSPAALRTGAGVAAAQTAGSTIPTYLLIVLIALAAVGMGMLATRGSRGRGKGRPPAGF
jgi:hypothetical protein